jgi:gliding motility-associated-like protein
LQDSFVSTLTLTFADNCTSEVSKSISIDQLRPKVDYSYKPADCPDDSTVSLLFKYEDKDSKGLSNNGINWLIGEANDINPYVNTPVTLDIPKDSTIYGSIFTEYENGCKDTLLRQFIPGPYATLKFIEDSLVLCPGEVKHLIANGNPDFDYTWTPTTNLNLDKPYDPIITANKDQTYEVIVSDGLCNVKGKVNVEVLESLVLSIVGGTTTCDGSVDLVANGGFGAGTYTWYADSMLTQKVFEGDSLKTVFNTIEQKYFVTFKSEKACNAQPASIKVVNQTPRFDVVSPSELCFGDKRPTNNVFNLVPEHTIAIVWDTDPHIVSGGSTLKPIVTTIDSNEKAFTLYFTAFNQHFCDYRDSVQFKVISNPVVDFTYEVKDCKNYQVCFKFNNTSSTQLFGTPKWTFGDTKTAPGTENVEICNTYPKAGTYFVVLSNLTQICPFKDVIDTIVLNDQFPVFDNDKAEDCINTDYTLTLPDKAKGQNYVWQDTKGNVISTLPNPKVDIKSDTSFILKVEDENGCAFSDTFSVKAFVFDTKLKIDELVCTYGIYPISATANAGVNFSYQWSPANAIVSGGNTANPTVDVAKATKYTVKLTNGQLGCTTEETVEFNTFKFDSKKNEPSIYCLNQTANPSITILPALNYQYEWSPASQIVSGGNTSSPTVNIIGDGKIYVKVTNTDLGCVLRDSFDVETTELVINVDAEPSGEVRKGQTVELTIVDPKPGYTYTWSNGFVGTKQNVKIDEEVTFTVTATDENGCEGDDEISFKIKPLNCVEDVYLPTAFSPNADGNNEILFVRSAYPIEMELVVFNRWGQEVFSSKDQNIGWDGTLRGEALAPDVYAYWLKAKCVEGDEIVRKGNISLLR